MVVFDVNLLGDMICGGSGVCVEPCDDDSDCGSGQVCSGGVCTNPCDDDSDCPGSGQFCGGGDTCEDGCSSDTDCGTGQVCSGGQCTDMCTSNGDCSNGQICVMGACDQPCTPGSCGTGQTCVNGTCEQDCTIDSDCESNECLPASGTCGEQCTQDSQCSDCGYCDEIEGVCVEPDRTCPECKEWNESSCSCENTTGPCGDGVHFMCIDGECTCDFPDVWDVGDPITPPTIDEPEADAVVAAGEEITLNCSGATDPDEHSYCTGGNEWVTEYPSDDISYTWTAVWAGTSTPAGTVTDADNRDPQASWTAPATGGDVTITVTADDDGLHGTDDDGTEPASVTITVEKVDITLAYDPFLARAGHTVFIRAVGSNTISWTDDSGRDPSSAFPNGTSTDPTQVVHWLPPDEASKVVVTATAGSGSGSFDTVTMAVAKVELKIHNGGNNVEYGQMVSDAEEVTPGAFLLLNWDDDNDNGIPDYEDTGWPVGEDDDDLAKLVVQWEFPWVPQWSMDCVLNVDAYGNALWHSDRKLTEVVSDGDGDYTWSFPTSTERELFFYFEGKTTSGGVGDIDFTLTMFFNDQLLSDMVTATVVTVHLGNAVYRECSVWDKNLGHSAIVMDYTGPCTLDDFRDAENFEVGHMQSSGPVAGMTLDNITNHPEVLVFCPWNKVC